LYRVPVLPNTNNTVFIVAFSLSFLVLVARERSLVE
jgi:hypothetical protein